MTSSQQGDKLLWDGKTVAAALWLSGKLEQEGLLGQDIYQRAVALILRRGGKEDGSVYGTQ